MRGRARTEAASPGGVDKELSMKGLQRSNGFLGKHAARAALSLVVATTAVGAMGCLDRPIERVEPRTTATVVERLTQSSVDKIDIVLAIDNSRSMADKQNILAAAVPDLVKGLVNPRCVDDNGVASMMQPGYPTDPCPVAGTKREFEPVLDIHIGIVSSSIGGHGADSCPDTDPTSKECSPNPNYTNNDKGHLLSRLDACGGGEQPTFKNEGFLAWDPSNKYGGETVIDAGDNKTGLVPSLKNMVIGVGQIGCGYESQLESWYRFLIDPEPYETISVVDNKATPMGKDMVLLQQRAEFMRPDSLLAVIMLTDENDCSIKEYGQFYYVGQLRVGQTNVHLPRARQECAANPNDPCCKSCGQNAGNCPADPTCTNAQGQVALLTAEEDSINLRCWDQKRRFGIDFLYGTDRYTKGLTSSTVQNRAGELVPNPIFSDLDPSDNDSNIRDPGLVFFAGIIGVPWQDIARDKTDLSKGFKSSEELLAPIQGSNYNTWDVILGDPANYGAPKDPLMIESIKPRTGQNPITGDQLVDAKAGTTNPINGHEWTIAGDDLQYACIFPLLPGTERNCTDSNLTSCDCSDATNDNPLCDPNPKDNNNPTQQSRAKAYPGVRELSVLKDVGSQGIVASVCPAQLTNSGDTVLDYGYRPAIGAIIERLKKALGGQCLPRTLTPDAKTGDIPCLILEARNSQGQCNCNIEARQDVQPEHEQAKKVAEKDPLAASAGWDCFCEIKQTTDAEREACQTVTTTPVQLNGQDVNGWCYVDATTTPATGNPEIVAKCPDNEKRIIRFVGKGEAQPGATLFITCSGE
jgi:hypothetical protein